MIEATLRLQRGNRPSGSVGHGQEATQQFAAWMIHGTQPSDWARILLAAIPKAGGTCEPDVQLIPIPKSINDRSAVGVLAIGMPSAALPPGVTAYRPQFPAGQSIQFYVPAASSLRPPISDDTLAELLAPNSIYVWHPQAGLVRASSREVLRLSDLIDKPRVLSSSFFTPPDPPSIASGVTTLARPSIDDVMQALADGGDGIGERSDHLDEIPPVDGERNGGFAKGSAWVMQHIAKGVLRMTRNVPRNSDQPTWVDRLEGWANRQMQQTARTLMGRGGKQLERLMQMLERDPDKGLQYAVPLSDAAGRGPSGFGGGDLGRRIVDFDFSRLGIGGGGIGGWELPADLWNRLMNRYRDLAQREENLGRYRRAAYVYAHLLNDFLAAARVLENGRHWLEAAGLYKERLSRPADAARCLMYGGKYDEAITLFEQEDQLLEAGDLLRQCGQSNRAEDCYRRAVAQRVGQHRIVDAAEILNDRLQERQEAFSLLTAQWPGGRDVVDSIETAMRWHGEDGNDEEAFRLLKQIQAIQPNDHWEFSGAVIGQTVSQSYPNDELRRKAADGTRLAVARLLPKTSQSESHRLVQLLGATRPSDQLLARDGRRYLARNQPLVKTEELRGTVDGLIKLVADFDLGGTGVVEDAIGVGDFVYATFREDDQLRFYRFSPAIAPELGRGKTWVVDSESYRGVSMHPVSGDSVTIGVAINADKTIAERISFGSRALAWTSAAIVPVAHDEGWHQTLAITKTDEFLYWLVRYHHTISLREIASDPHKDRRIVIEQSREVAHLGETIPGNRQNAVRVRDQRAFISYCGSLMSISVSPGADEDREHYDLDGFVSSMDMSPEGSELRIAVSAGSWVHCIWPTTGERSAEEFPWPNPLVFFLQSGLIVAAGAMEVRVYSAVDSVLRKIGETQISCVKCGDPEQNPIVAITEVANHLLLVYANGVLLRFEIGSLLDSFQIQT